MTATDGRHGRARPGSRTLLERERELASLWEAVDAAREQRGAVAIVEGEAGIGKTSLLEVTAARAAAAGVRVLRARGAALEREFGFGLARQLFERAVLDADENERTLLLTGAAGLSAPAIGLASLPAQPAAGDAAFAVQHGFYWLACNLAERAPLVLLIDDASGATCLRCGGFPTWRAGLTGSRWRC